MDTEQKVIEEDKNGSNSIIYICSSNGASRINTDKKLAAEIDEVLNCWKKFGCFKL